MTVWYRQHRESLLQRMPWHLEDPTPSKAAMLGLGLARCGTSVNIEDRASTGWTTCRSMTDAPPARAPRGA
jgi:hypothetical protein